MDERAHHDIPEEALSSQAVIAQVVCFSFALQGGDAIGHVRLAAPLRHAGIRLVDGMEEGWVEPTRIAESDLVVVQRDFPREYEAYRTVVEATRDAGKPLVFELDDLIYRLPETHPDRRNHGFLTALLPMLQALLEADMVLVPTNALQHALRALHPNVLVFPNYLDDELWEIRPPTRTEASRDTVTIGYMGTASHTPDLEFLAPVLHRLAERYPGRLRFRFWGVEPPASLRGLPAVEWARPYLRSYREFVSYFQTQSADIAIAPLVDNPFNRCKSPIKFLEYSAQGIPGVYSHIVYDDVVEHGDTGLLASSLEEWEASLIRLIEDPTFRARIAERAQDTVARHWRLSQNAHQWPERIQQGLQNSERPEGLEPFLGYLDAINVQLIQGFRDLTTQWRHGHEQVQELEIRLAESARENRALSEQVQELERRTAALHGELEAHRQQVQQLESEILGYVLSRSWRLTRPLRRIHRVLTGVKRRA